MRLAPALAPVLLLAALSPALAQGEERYVELRVPERGALNTLDLAGVSVDHGQDPALGVVRVYVDSARIPELERRGLAPRVLPHPGDAPALMARDIPELTASWRRYPTYDQYVEMMADYARRYPQLATAVTLGETQEGRQLLALRLGDRPAQDEDEPAVLLTSTMHGDETTGYVTLLRLIDTLLSGYGQDPEITALMDNVEIWINPLANPDGTYRGGDDTVSGARRFLANGVDANRNFPDPEDGPHPDGEAYAPETLAMMALAEARSFTLAANFHGGAEVVNYPWDTWARAHADEGWYIDLCRDWAESAQESSPRGYMTFADDGITNGYDWYEVDGGRQDYMNYVFGTREVTVELSDKKTATAALLPLYWEANRGALVGFLQASLTGIRGIVTDGAGAPVAATITVVGHDVDGSEVYTDPSVGDYHRPIAPGIYDLRITAPGHGAEVVSGVIVEAGGSVRVDVTLGD